MNISTQMNVEELRRRMGEATLEEAAIMRDLLVAEVGEGEQTADVSEPVWLSLLGKAVSVSESEAA